MDRDYSVFMSHAGTDKDAIAIPVYNRLGQRNIHAFVDRKELHAGDNGPQVMQYAMDTALVGLIILSPEFPARAWTMIELMRFQEREQEARQQGLHVPKLIPVFYRLDVRTCRSDALFQVRNEAGENVFVAEKFIERAARERITPADVARAMKQISLRTGIENHGQVTNEDSADMQQRRNVFIDHLVDKVEDAVKIAKDPTITDDAARYSRTRDAAGANSAVEAPRVTVNAGSEKFTSHFEVRENLRYVFLRMSLDDPEDPLASREAQACNFLVNEATHDYEVVAIQGMPGVGKTCLLRALCHDRAIRARFTDGVYVVRLGADANLQAFLEALGGAVEASRGHKSAAVIRRSQNLSTAVNASMKWFANRTCLFLLDDVWSKPVDGTEYLEALSRICAGGKDSALVFSSREKRLLYHKRVTHEVCLLAHKTRDSLSRSILLRTATGSASPTLESPTDVLLNHLLDACGGLPVALAVAGRAIFTLAIDMNRDYDRAISLYHNEQAKSRSAIIYQCADDEYVSLMTALDVSINVLHRTRSEDDVVRTFYSWAEMHRSLCVLKKQQWVPISMLRWLWNTDSDEEAIFIADKLSEVGLVDVQLSNWLRS